MRLWLQMVGRERQRAELTGALDKAIGGRGSVTLLLGEAGIGKSTLAGWAIAEAAGSGMAVGQGGCSAAGLLALWPLRRAMADGAPGLLG